MSVIKSIKNWNWNRIGWFLGISIFVPFISLVTRLIDVQFYDVDIINDVYYSYLNQINIVLWVILWYVMGIHYKKEK